MPELIMITDDDVVRFEKICRILRKLQANSVTKTVTVQQAATEVLRLDPSLKVAGMQWSDWVDYVAEVLKELGLCQNDAAMSLSLSEGRRRQVVDCLLSLTGEEGPAAEPTREQQRHHQVANEVIRANDNRYADQDPLADMRDLLTPAEIKELDDLLDKTSKNHRRDKRAAAKAFITILRNNVEKG